MAGVTLTVLTRHDRDYKASVSSAAAGSPATTEIEVVYDDTVAQEDIVKALDKAKAYVLENVTVR